MDKEHFTLLKNLFSGGSIRVDNVVESRILLDDLIQAGLVEINWCEGSVPGGPACAEYRLTREGRSLAGSLHS